MARHGRGCSVDQTGKRLRAKAGMQLPTEGREFLTELLKAHHKPGLLSLSLCSQAPRKKGEENALGAQTNVC